MRERRRGYRGVQTRSEQIPMAQVHRDEPEPDEQECQQQRQAVGIVEAGDQHEQQQHGKPQTRLGGQDVDPAPLQSERQGIEPLATADPSREPQLPGRAQRRCAHEERI